MECAAKDKCAVPGLPLPDRMKHFCAVCFKEMHGCCGVFNGNKDADPTYYNRCFDCDAAHVAKPVRRTVAQKCPRHLPDADTSGTDSEGENEVMASSSSAKCSYRQCKGSSAAFNQCSVAKCGKMIHEACLQDYLLKLVLDPLPPGVFSCGTKVHYLKVQKTNQVLDPAGTRWNADGPSGPDTVPNSLSVLLSWWTTEGNYNQYRGGKNQAGKSKEAYWALLSDQIKNSGIKVERSPASIGAKIGRMEEQYRETSEWISKTGHRKR